MFTVVTLDRVDNDDGVSKELAQDVIVCCMLLTLRCSTRIVAGPPARHHINVKSSELRLKLLSMSLGRRKYIMLTIMMYAMN